MKSVAILGSSQNLEESKILAEELGIILAKNGIIVVTGAGEGLPLDAAAAAKKAGGMTIGISPEINSAEQSRLHPKQEGVFDFTAHTGFGQKGRNVVLVRSVDAVLIIGGGLGTINEFAIAYDEGKIIGVLEGSGGASEKIRELVPLGAHKNTGAKVVYSNDPKELVEKISKLLK